MTSDFGSRQLPPEMASAMLEEAQRLERLAAPEYAPAPCQCAKCLRYLARDRTPYGPQICVACAQDYLRGQSCTCDARGWSEPCEAHVAPASIPLAGDHHTMRDPLTIELLALLAEEMGEVQQRVGKVLRWGWDVRHQGSDMQTKLEAELGDVLAAFALLVENGQIVGTEAVRAMLVKLEKFREDAATTRQRLLHARVPADAEALRYLSEDR